MPKARTASTGRNRCWGFGSSKDPKRTTSCGWAQGRTNFYFFKDENPSVPASEKYKGLAGYPLFALRSADGLRLEKMREEPVIRDGAFDSQNVAFWDPLRGLYVAIYRDFLHGVRTIKSATSPDFLSWSSGRVGRLRRRPFGAPLHERRDCLFACASYLPGFSHATLGQLANIPPGLALARGC